MGKKQVKAEESGENGEGRWRPEEREAGRRWRGSRRWGREADRCEAE